MSQILEAGTNRPLRVAIHQPNFLPRLKILQKLAYADVWCVLDNVQFCAREWQNRARIVTAHGNNESFWLSIPVHRPHGLRTRISEVVIAEPNLTELLVERTLLHSFHRAPHWAAIDDLFSAFKPLLATDNLTRLCVDTTCALLNIGCVSGWASDALAARAFDLSAAGGLCYYVCKSNGIGYNLIDFSSCS